MHKEEQSRYLVFSTSSIWNVPRPFYLKGIEPIQFSRKQPVISRNESFAEYWPILCIKKGWPRQRQAMFLSTTGCYFQRLGSLQELFMPFVSTFYCRQCKIRRLLLHAIYKGKIFLKAVPSLCLSYGWHMRAIVANDKSRKRWEFIIFVMHRWIMNDAL